ncbi:hypothetical protein WMY93_025509 [Mugilogobius chulae]|uniref:P2X purinoreceptor 7 intracellular domain-containing protein n=1 Tax=Mugilogobius chulae TaxID=88201 RepID=A0AAW0N5V3_9GOBI
MENSVLPFQFEPERAETSRGYEREEEEEYEDELSNGQSGEEERLGHSSWCLCSNCTAMATSKESVCCKELDFISAAVHSLPCVTAHPSFYAVCLNPDVLWAALVSLHDRRSSGLPARTQVSNRSYRYAAYRQFTWWMHGWLGKRVRRVIPACAVNHIRLAYPENSGTYTGYCHIESEVEQAWMDF